MQFDVFDGELYRAEARKAAVQNAMTKAKDLAEAAGATVGNIIEIEEGGGRSGLQSNGSANIGLGYDVPIAEGKVTIRSQVVMVFELIQ
ncbi:MAG: SIMPL domain-containing protein [Paracoccaceae bacterium]